MKIVVALAPLAMLAACSPLGGDAGLHVPAHGGSYAPVQSYTYGHCASTACAPGQGYSVAPGSSSYLPARAAQQGHHVRHGHPVQHGHHAQARQPAYPVQPARPARPVQPAYPVPYRQPVQQMRPAFPAPYIQPQGVAPRGPQTITAPYAAYGTAVPGVAGGLRGRHDEKKGYGFAELGVTNYDFLESVAGVQGRIGYQSPYYIGAELEGSVGFLNETTNVTYGLTDPDTGVVTAVTEDLDVGIDNQVAAFLRLAKPFGGTTYALRGGYHRTEFGVSGDQYGSITIAEEGPAAGLSTETPIGRNSAIRTDATFYDTDAGTLNAFSIGYQQRF